MRINLPRWLRRSTPAERLQRMAERAQATIVELEADLIYTRGRLASLRQWERKLEEMQRRLG